MSRRSREDVVRAAGRLFGERGYHGTSMRDLGKELGLVGSSLYAHVEGKQQLLVEVVSRGAELFSAAADSALTVEGSAADRLRALIDGHVGVVLDHREEVRTYLNEAVALDSGPRRQVVAARDRYEAAYRTVLEEGASDGSFRSDVDPVLDAIFTLSILNAVDRWYRESGRIGRSELVEAIYGFVLSGLH